MAKLPSRNHLHNHCVFYVLVIDLLKYVLSYNVIIFVPKTGTCNGIFKFNFLALVQWRRQDFFSGGLGPLPPSFPFSSLPPFPLLSPFPSSLSSPSFPAPHRPVARIVKTRRQIDRAPLHSLTLPFPALTSPSLPYPAHRVTVRQKLLTHSA